MNSKWSTDKGSQPGDHLHWKLRWIPSGSSNSVPTKFTHRITLGHLTLHRPKSQPSGQPEIHVRVISDLCCLKNPPSNHRSLLFLFYLDSVSTSGVRTSWCSFSPTIEVDFSSEKKGPQLIGIKASLATTTFNLTGEHFAFTVQYKFKKSVSVNSNLKKQVRQHCWTSFLFSISHVHLREQGCVCLTGKSRK